MGNDKADEIVDKGTLIYGNNILKIAKYLQKRHRDYTKFVKEVAQHIAEAYMIHRTLVGNTENEECKGRTKNDLKVSIDN